ncbi:uncharacterized protein [Clytia hemisphaerica]|uniref:uncharacterized protein n=1 Tax=Clytia hemisphaerica TaxID=252671 RepID=UPI0034D4D415
MRILYANADQFTSGKLIELQAHVQKKKPHLIAICEVKTKVGQLKHLHEYEFGEYTLVNQTNVDTNKGRGIIILSHNSIKHLIVRSSTVEFEEACTIEVRLADKDLLVFACLYRSPTKTRSSDESNTKLNSLVKSISLDKKYSHKILIGDFNYPTINWENWITSHNEESKEEQFLDALRDSFLHQHVDEPTRCRGSDDPSTIDLIFTDEKESILQCVFTNEPEGEVPDFPSRTEEIIDDIVITKEMLSKKIKELDTNKSLGPDEIHPKMLKELVDEIAEPLSRIMNKTLTERELPEDWKLAHVTPIYKNKGAHNLAVNYRPVSLTSVVFKLMESILREHITRYLTNLKLLSKKQYGFISRRSTVTQLLMYIDKCCESMSEDDTKTFKEVNSINDSLVIQKDVDTLNEWSKVWLLKFHPDKCHVLTLGKLANIKHAHPYSLAGNQLEHAFEEKDLGVLVDAELMFEEHIAKQVKNENERKLNVAVKELQARCQGYVKERNHVADTIQAQFLALETKLTTKIEATMNAKPIDNKTKTNSKKSFAEITKPMTS